MPVDNYSYPSFGQTNFVSDFYKPPNNPYFNTEYSETYYPEWSNQSTSPEFQTQEKELGDTIGTFDKHVIRRI